MSKKKWLSSMFSGYDICDSDSVIAYQVTYPERQTGDSRPVLWPTAAAVQFAGWGHLARVYLLSACGQNATSGDVEPAVMSVGSEAGSRFGWPGRLVWDADESQRSKGR